MTGNTRKALVVFGHGSRDPAWSSTLTALRDRLREALPGVVVENAYLEFIGPTLDECVESLWQRGCNDIALLPAFVAAGAHLREELPRLATNARGGREGMLLRILPAMGDLPEVHAGVVNFVANALEVPGTTGPSRN